MIAAAVELLGLLAGLLRLFGGVLVRALFSGHPRFFLRPAARALRRGAELMRRELYQGEAEAQGLDHPAMDGLRREAAGLDSLLGERPFAVSILVPGRPEVDSAALARSLASCLTQAPAELEVLFGQPYGLPPRLVEVARSAEAGSGGRLRVVPTTGPAESLAALVAAARHDWLLLADAGGWLRPDLLYRYHQLLLTESPATPRLLACAGWRLDGRGGVVGEADLLTSARPHLPLAFNLGDLDSAVLLPAAPARELAPSAGTPLELVLAVAAAGTPLLAVPIPLCGRPPGLPAAARAAALRGYFAALGRSWQVSDELRIFPARPAAPPTIGVVMPFRDRPELTLAAARAVLAQAWPGVELVAVDNGSRDPSLAGRLAELGAKVRRREEPFNFSRLINAGLAGGHSELVLLLNNDVELAAGALEELAAWACQPEVGLVGPALFYADGRLQHGGLELDPAGRAGELPWRLIERGYPADRLAAAARLRVVDAVSGACAMVRRRALEQVGGLDEIFYPNAFSDTDLALRLGKLGLLHVYTPYARGIHHESASRPGDRREDFEGSAFWHDHLAARRGPACGC